MKWPEKKFFIALFAILFAIPILPEICSSFPQASAVIENLILFVIIPLVFTIFALMAIMGPRRDWEE